MQAHLSGIDVGKEVFSNDQQQCSRSDDKYAKAGQYPSATMQAPSQHRLVIIAELLKFLFELLMNAPDRALRFFGMNIWPACVERQLRT